MAKHWSEGCDDSCPMYSESSKTNWTINCAFTKSKNPHFDGKITIKGICLDYQIQPEVNNISQMIFAKS